jgi:hypothetical protein
MAKFTIAFVSLLAASASAFTAPQQHAIQSSSSLMMTTESGARAPIKVGVIGCGRIGIVHLGAINKAPGVVPVVVSNPTISKAEDGEWKLMLAIIALLHNRNVNMKHLLESQPPKSLESPNLPVMQWK